MKRKEGTRLGKNNSTNYEYQGESEERLSEPRKKELIHAVNKMISKNNSIALYKILGLATTEEEYQFLFNYLEESGILIRGINTSLAGEIPNYEHLPRDGQSYLPPILTPEEEENLFELKNTGSEEERKSAREELIARNIRLVNWIVGTRAELRYSGISKEDLISFGYEALIKAVDKFENKGYKFSTYAVEKIYWEIRNQIIREPSLMHIPAYLTERIREIKRAQNIIAIEKQREGIQGGVTVEEIAAITGLPKISIINALSVIELQEFASIESMIDEDHNETLDKLVGDETVTMASGYYVDGNNSGAYGTRNAPVQENVDIIQDGVLVDREEPEVFSTDEDMLYVVSEAVEMRERLRDLLDTLTPREQTVLEFRFGLKDGVWKSLEETGRNFNVTPERIRQIEAKALRKLRHPSRKERLEGLEKITYQGRYEEYIEAAVDRPKDNFYIFTSANLAEPYINDFEVLKKISDIINEEGSLDKIKILLQRAIEAAERNGNVSRRYLLRYIKRYIETAKKPTFTRVMPDDDKLLQDYFELSENTESVRKIEEFLLIKAFTLIDYVAHENKEVELKRGKTSERKMARKMGRIENSPYSTEVQQKLLSDVKKIFNRKYSEIRANPEIIDFPKALRKDIEDSKKYMLDKAIELTKEYFHLEYDFTETLMPLWLSYMEKYENQPLNEPELSDEEKTLFDNILQRIDEIRAAREENIRERVREEEQDSRVEEEVETERQDAAEGKIKSESNHDENGESGVSEEESIKKKQLG